MREKLIELIGATHYGNSLVGENFQEGFIAKIADHLIANGVEIPVRCKDCIHWYEKEEVCLKIYSDGAVSPYAWQFRKPDDFCSYGERRTE